MHASASAHERLSMERSALPTYAESFAKVGFRGGRVSAVSGGEDSRGLRAHPRVHRDEHTAVARQTMPLRREWREQEPLDAAPAKTSTSEEKYPYEYPDFQGYEEPRPPNYGGRARHRDLEGPRAQRRREAVAASRVREVQHAAISRMEELESARCSLVESYESQLEAQRGRWKELARRQNEEHAREIEQIERTARVRHDIALLEFTEQLEEELRERHEAELEVLRRRVDAEAERRLQRDEQAAAAAAASAARERAPRTHPQAWAQPQTLPPREPQLLR